MYQNEAIVYRFVVLFVSSYCLIVTDFTAIATIFDETQHIVLRPNYLTLFKILSWGNVIQVSMQWRLDCIVFWWRNVIFLYVFRVVLAQTLRQHSFHPRNKLRAVNLTFRIRARVHVWTQQKYSSYSILVQNHTSFFLSFETRENEISSFPTKVLFILNNPDLLQVNNFIMQVLACGRCMC